MPGRLQPKHRQELEERGYTVVRGVLTEEECQLYIQEYIDWVERNFDPGVFPHCKNSLIQRYSIGHLSPSWSVRLKAKPVYEQLWGTKELITSIDAVAIGRPPEQGEEDFYSPDSSWLHLDQGAGREGLHAYQGAVYLETADKDDWVFECMEGSHKHFKQFFDEHPTEREASIRSTEHFKLDEDHVKWYRQLGCLRNRVAVPKGGLLLWDSRLVHDNARPINGRVHSERWRFVVIVCMGPAAWADHTSLRLKKKAYRDLRLTNHWPCTGTKLFPNSLPDKAAKPKHPLKELPEVAKCLEAKQLVGIAPYNNNKTGKKSRKGLDQDSDKPGEDLTGDGPATNSSGQDPLEEASSGPPPPPKFSEDYRPPRHTGEGTVDAGWVAVALFSAFVCALSIYVFVYVIHAGE